jgi:hypothetical protein
MGARSRARMPARGQGRGGGGVGGMGRALSEQNSAWCGVLLETMWRRSSLQWAQALLRVRGLAPPSRRLPAARRFKTGLDPRAGIQSRNGGVAAACVPLPAGWSGCVLRQRVGAGKFVVCNSFRVGFQGRRCASRRARASRSTRWL